MPALGPMEWLIAGAAAVSLYVLVDMWVRERHGQAPAPADGQE